MGGAMLKKRVQKKHLIGIPVKTQKIRPNVNIKSAYLNDEEQLYKNRKNNYLST